MFRGDGNELLQVDLLDVLLAALLDDEDCRAAEVCAQLDFVCTSVCVEALLSDDLTHGVHEHCGCVGNLACVECGVNRTRLHVHEHLRGCSGARHADSACAACDSDDLARCGTFELRFLIEVIDDFGRTVGLDALDIVDRDRSRNLSAVEVETDGVHGSEACGFSAEISPLDLESLERGSVELLVCLFHDICVKPCP